MTRIVLLTARDPLRAADGPFPARVARELAEGGDEVTLVLLEDAVGLARTGHAVAGGLREALDAGVTVLADAEALSRRAVTAPAEGVKPVELAEVVDLLMTHSDRQAWL